MRVASSGGRANVYSSIRCFGAGGCADRAGALRRRSLDRAEFERRYSAMPEVKKAELIEGVVYMPPPVSQKRHSRQHFLLIGWLNHYNEATPGLEGGDNATIRLDRENDPQPDALLRIVPAFGGQSRDSGEYIGGPPEPDRGGRQHQRKLRLARQTKGVSAQRRARVHRMARCRVAESAIDWFVLRNDRYERLELDVEGCYRSQVFPGLWLNSAALVRGDMTRHAAVWQRGLASPEHAAFATELAKRGR